MVKKAARAEPLGFTSFPGQPTCDAVSSPTEELGTDTKGLTATAHKPSNKIERAREALVQWIIDCILPTTTMRY